MARNGMRIVSEESEIQSQRRRAEAEGAADRSEFDSRRQRRINTAAWLFVVALLIAQFGLWRQFALREVVWAYPTNFDQLAYLEQSYQTYERVLQHGLITGLEEGMGLKFGHLPMNAAGATLHLQAAVLYLMTGVSRLSALSLNFIYWAAFQLALVATLRWLTGRWSATFLGWGLLLTTITPFFPTGGSLFDFRLDFIAFCLFGIFICAVIRSGVFADWRWSALAGFVAAVLGTFRFITLAYLLGIFVTFGIFLIVLWVMRWRDLPAQQAVQRKIRGMIVAGLVIALLAGPVIWHHRQAIRSYYGLHVSGEEKMLRAQQSGTTTLAANLKYYPHSLIEDHAGYGFWILTYVLIALALATDIARRSLRKRSLPVIDPTAAIGFAVACLIIPDLVLTRDIAKSPIVGGIMVAPLVWLIVMAALFLFGAARRQPLDPIGRRVMSVACVIAMLAAGYLQFSEYSRRTLLGAHRPEVEKVDAMWDRMARDCQVLGWNSPAIASDSLQDFLYHKILSILAYEKYGVVLNSGASIGRLEAYDAKELYDRLALSDFAIITRNTGPPVFEFPFDRQMREWHGDILKWCRQNMVELEHEQLGAPFERDVTLFIRPGVGMRAAADGWITSDGMDVTALAPALREYPVIELRGQADFALLHDRTPHVSAKLRQPDGGALPLAADFDRSGSHYTITVRTDPARAPAAGPVVVHLDFDNHFVPKQIGANADTRELVMKLPDSGALRRNASPARRQ